MYISTFYSFKGGVGRTMALVNAAVELAQRGRRVLAVDFDLEAPGLDTFDILGAARDQPGIVDFVREYVVTGQAPEVERFVSQSADLKNLWVMPSGSQQQYAASLGGIDWQDLYEHRDGYLLFEDLKAQWRASLQPDYVLIDSRTGHTDTCGICTRQLPDAVTFLFFPNEQNLRGLAEVVRDIRAESENLPERRIETHFVMSNVPDLDDEDDILPGMMARFREDLGIDPEPQIVHRYDSLSLLNQVVFTRHRPKSRLAKEYRGVVDQVVAGNLEDKDGALGYIDHVRRSDDRDRDKKLEKIEQHHSENAEVIFRLGDLAGDEEDWERAKSLLDRAVDLGYDQPKAFLARARSLARMGESTDARRDVERVLHALELPLRVVQEAMRLIGLDSPDAAKLPAVTSLDPEGRLLLAAEMARRGEVHASVAVLRQVLDTDPDASTRECAVDELSLALIATGEWQEASDLLNSGGPVVEAKDEGTHGHFLARRRVVARVFNYGMALWGSTGNVPQEVFERVVELNEADNEDDKGANYWQCMAIAYWAVGRLDAAIEFARKAKEEADRSLRPIFSCWRYRTVPTPHFLEDTDDIIALILGDKDSTPRFMSLSAES